MSNQYRLTYEDGTVEVVKGQNIWDVADLYSGGVTKIELLQVGQ